MDPIFPDLRFDPADSMGGSWKNPLGQPSNNRATEAGHIGEDGRMVEIGSDHDRQPATLCLAACIERFFTERRVIL